MTKRTIFIILAFLIIILIIGFVIISGKVGQQSSGAEGDDSGFINTLFPFGDNNGDGGRPNNTNGSNVSDSSQTITNSGQKLQQLTEVSVAGYIATTSESGVINIRYMERSSGNIFSINLETLQKSRITNTTLPEVHNIVWHKDAEQFVARFIDKNDVIKTYLGNIAKGTTTEPSEVLGIDGIFLEDEIRDLVVNSQKTKILYTTPDSLGVTGTILSFDGGDKEVIFESDFGEWNLHFEDDNTLTATSKASFIANGFSYTVNTDTGEFRKIFGGMKGFTVLPSLGADLFLFSEYINERFVTKLFNKNDRRISTLSLSTLPEKCTWSKINKKIAYCGIPVGAPNAEYPDMWYQGVVSFSDNIWEYDADTNLLRILVSPLEVSGQDIDATNLETDAGGNYLFFVNKKDSTLWSLELEKPVEEIEEFEEEEVESPVEEQS